MSDDPRQYFLAVDGAQSGPFTAEQIRGKIYSAEARPESLVWYEGLSGWVKLETVEFFSDSWSSTQNTPAEDQPGEHVEPASAQSVLLDLTAGGAERFDLGADETPRQQEAQSSAKQSPLADALRDSVEGPGPVFGGEKSPVWELNRKTLGYAGLAVGSVVVVVALLVGGSNKTPDTIPATDDIKTSAHGVAEKLSAESRLAKVHEAESSLALKSTGSIAVLRTLVLEKSDDVAAEQAFALLKRHYTNIGQVEEYARLSIAAKRFRQGAEILEKRGETRPEAAKAYYAQYQTSEVPEERFDSLVRFIQIAAGDPTQKDKIVGYVQQCEKEFPDRKHPFGYYLQSSDQRITSLFTRLSPVLVDQLVNFVRTEFPDVHLAKEPMVRLEQDKSGQYRITAAYNGDIHLRSDTVRRSRFTFWHIDGRWFLVGTNFTKERSRYAAAVRAKYADRWTPAAQLIGFLETSFESAFPGSGFYEAMPTGSRQPTSAK